MKNIRHKTKLFAFVLRKYKIYKVEEFIKKILNHLKLFKKSIIMYFYYKKHQTYNNDYMYIQLILWLL